MSLYVRRRGCSPPEKAVMDTPETVSLPPDADAVLAELRAEARHEPTRQRLRRWKRVLPFVMFEALILFGLVFFFGAPHREMHDLAGTLIALFSMLEMGLLAAALRVE